jgi:chlorite dismutase
MPAPLEPSVGWGVLHLFCKAAPLADGEAVTAAVTSAEGDGVQVVTTSMLGHKCDLGFMALGADLWRLRQLQTELVSAGLELVDSYVSLTELSEYNPNPPEELKAARLNPNLPPEGKAAFCFYPMSKKRGEVNNWFTLPHDDRKELMYAHGMSGRKFSGRVLQVVTGSTGIDDFEWGVTLFAVHPDDLKEVVYTMRFDEASSLYAEFGPFYAGMVAPLTEVLTSVGIT